MQIKLIALPFHWVHPYAPAKYRDCLAVIPVYDPDARDWPVKAVDGMRVSVFNAAVGSVRGKPYKGPKLPKSVLLPVRIDRIIREDFGSGLTLKRINRGFVSYRKFLIEDLVAKPFTDCRGESIPMKTQKKLERAMSECR